MYRGQSHNSMRGGGGDLLFYRGEIVNILLYWANPTHIPALWKSLGSIYRYQSKSTEQST